MGYPAYLLSRIVSASYQLLLWVTASVTQSLLSGLKLMQRLAHVEVVLHAPLQLSAYLEWITRITDVMYY
jgi:hypothetical protein